MTLLNTWNCTDMTQSHANWVYTKHSNKRKPIKGLKYSKLLLLLCIFPVTKGKITICNVHNSITIYHVGSRVCRNHLPWIYTQKITFAETIFLKHVLHAKRYVLWQNISWNRISWSTRDLLLFFLWTLKRNLTDSIFPGLERKNTSGTYSAIDNLRGIKSATTFRVFLYPNCVILIFGALNRKLKNK